MGFLKKLDDWVVRKKEEKLSQKHKNPFRLCNSDISEFKCPECGHDKAFNKKGRLKCTRCGYKER